MSRKGPQLRQIYTKWNAPSIRLEPATLTWPKNRAVLTRSKANQTIHYTYSFILSNNVQTWLWSANVSACAAPCCLWRVKTEKAAFVVFCINSLHLTTRGGPIGFIHILGDADGTMLLLWYCKHASPAPPKIQIHLHLFQVGWHDGGFKVLRVLYNVRWRWVHSDASINELNRELKG